MAESSRYVLDLAALHAAVTAVARHRQITMREVAAETGMSPSTLTRIGQGHGPDADGLVTLLTWLRASPGDFTRPRANGTAMPHG